jgi:hypothetical protein
MFRKIPGGNTNVACADDDTLCNATHRSPKSVHQFLKGLGHKLRVVVLDVVTPRRVEDESRVPGQLTQLIDPAERASRLRSQSAGDRQKATGLFAEPSQRCAQSEPSIRTAGR